MASSQGRKRLTRAELDAMPVEELLAYSPERLSGKLPYESFPVHALIQTIRFIGGWTYCFTLVALIWLVFLATGWLHPLLRKLGVHARYLPVNALTAFWAWSTIWMGGIRVETENEHHLDHRKGAILVCNHTSGIDSIAAIGSTPASVKFIMKQELLYMNPFMFGLAWATGHIPISRSNHEKAVASINAAAKSIRENKVCVAIFPEGTRSKDGRLQSFKKGAFHLALEAGVPLVPARISGSHDVWGPHMMWPHYGTMKITFLPPIDIPAGMTVDELLIQVRKVLIEAIEADTYTSRRTSILQATLPCTLWTILMCLLGYWYWYM